MVHTRHSQPHQITIQNHKCAKKNQTDTRCDIHAKYRLAHIYEHMDTYGAHMYLKSKSMNAIVTWIDFDVHLTGVRFCEWS